MAGIESDTDAAQNLIQQVGESLVSNPWVAGRMPPETCCGLHPAGDLETETPGFFDVYAHAGDLMGILREGLGEPLANPSLAFSRAVTAPGFAETYDKTFTLDA